MPPNVTSPDRLPCDVGVHHSPPPRKEDADKQPEYEWRIVWRNVVVFIYLHVATVYGLYLALTAAKWATVYWTVLVGWMATTGVQAGAHRLWAHRSYKAKLPLRLVLAVWNTIAFQNHIYEWVRDHRVHHKFTDTDADPHNSRRGFFFSHIGWLMVRKHPLVREKGRQLDMSDLRQDPVVMWQMRLYPVIMPLFCFVLPAWIPVALWGESGWVSWHLASVLRYTVSLNITWCINSVAHVFGHRPFDKSISATDSLAMGAFGLGEGWHNFHHTFPGDYKAAELGGGAVNATAAFIRLMAALGQAYDLQTVPAEALRARAARTGDGSHPSVAAGRPPLSVGGADPHYRAGIRRAAGACS
ncbi:acyl-CoA Delta-9 desaturase-like [Schistocerca piceifrons]|uniref:acyl-CoA Delta-9 desaturase-like n=1 Tax=Schistocerca piceifrons TaxID=274613 RepID=UPI001F5F292F|nr:acyl-CoA Delta-9 desaturase-like [Schistocerca piceifrons]